MSKQNNSILNGGPAFQEGSKYLINGGKHKGFTLFIDKISPSGGSFDYLCRDMNDTNQGMFIHENNFKQFIKTGFFTQIWDHADLSCLGEVKNVKINRLLDEDPKFQLGQVFYWGENSDLIRCIGVIPFDEYDGHPQAFFGWANPIQNWIYFFEVEKYGKILPWAEHMIFDQLTTGIFRYEKDFPSSIALSED